MEPLLLAFLMLMQAIGSAVLITLDLDLVVPFSLFLGIVFIGLIGAIRRLRPLVVMHVICSVGVVAWLTTCLVIMIVGPWPPLIVVALAALTDAVMVCEKNIWMTKSVLQSCYGRCGNLH